MSNAQISSSGLVDQIGVIYCTQLHLYERCTELVDLPAFKGEKKRLNKVIQLSARRVQLIESFFSLMGWDNSFINCDALISYLEEKFAPNYEKHSIIYKRIYMNNYLLNIHLNASAADVFIQNLASTQKNHSEIDRLLKAINLSQPLVTL